MAEADSLRLLLDKLSSGDPEAAQRVFLEHEPYLRLVVRRQLTPALRSKFDSLDIVQSVWADLLGGFRDGRWQFANSEQLRAFLIKVTRNRFIDRVRQQQRALHREHPLGLAEVWTLPPAPTPSASAQVEADELWQQLQELCPAQHRELLSLKRDGFSLAEIAARTSLHESSVRRVLYELAARLAQADSRRCSDRVSEEAAEGIGA